MIANETSIHRKSNDLDAINHTRSPNRPSKIIKTRSAKQA